MHRTDRAIDTQFAAQPDSAERRSTRECSAMPASLWSRSEWPRLALNQWLPPLVVSSGLAALVAYQTLSIGRALLHPPELGALADRPRESRSVARAANAT